MDLNEIKTLVDKTGEAFAAFKEAHEQNTKKRDGVLDDKISKIEKSLDDAIEAKSALEAKIASEKKEREELELRIQRAGKEVKTGDKAELELKSFNIELSAHASDRKRQHTDLTPDGFAAYKAAFNALLRKDERLLTPDEIKTLLVGSDPDGGYLVTPDMSGRIVRKVYESSPMRQEASVQAISTNSLEGIEDLGEAGAGYAGEQSQGSDSTTPQVGKWSIPVYVIDTEPKATQSILDDAAIDIEAWLAAKIADKFGRFENAEFVAGATNIRGFTSYPGLADSGSGVTWESLGYVATGTSGDFGSTVATTGDKLVDVMGLLKMAYLTNAKWYTRRSIITKIRKFKIGATVDAYMWQPGLQAGEPERILGYPVVRMEDMPALAADSFSLAFGDMRQAYQIVDRIGIRTLRDPYTSKPYVKFYTTKRVGGGVVNFEALKLLKFGTS